MGRWLVDDGRAHVLNQGLVVMAPTMLSRRTVTTTRCAAWAWAREFATALRSGGHEVIVCAHTVVLPDTYLPEDVEHVWAWLAAQPARHVRCGTTSSAGPRRSLAQEVR
ncbi:hypothetical protein [Saccharopolyspora shandongensis]|uniref:hypothetical protein n=1 Tax=Saccharopolyspora shandongensis TaxID=418495 RepID=UPI00340313C8